MQQNSQKKSMPKRLCVTNVTGALLACLYIFYEKISLKEDKVWKKFFVKQKLLSRFSHKAGRLLSSAVLLRKFTNVVVTQRLLPIPNSEVSAQHKFFTVYFMVVYASMSSLS